MKHFPFKVFFATIALSATLSVMSCKSKNGEADNNDTASTYMEPKLDNTKTDPDTMAVEVSPDASLQTMAKDAVADFPGVSATVNNGEVTLTGTITRAKLPDLMKSVNGMHPKKINNNLTIQ